MLYTGSFEMRINLPFSYDGVGSDSFCLYQMAAKSTWVTALKNTVKCVQTGQMQRTTSELVLYVSVWFLLTNFRLSNSVPFLN